MHSSYWYREYSYRCHASYPSYANSVEIASLGFEKKNVDDGFPARWRVSYVNQTFGACVYSHS